MAGVAEPYRVDDPAELAQKLALGHWIVFRHEYLGDVCDLETWLAEVREECLRLNVIDQPIAIPGKDLTVIVNAGNIPDFDLVQESVSRVLVDRWLGRELGPELAVRVARGE